VAAPGEPGNRSFDQRTDPVKHEHIEAHVNLDDEIAGEVRRMRIVA
jgi:hypothetical protein